MSTPAFDTDLRATVASHDKRLGDLTIQVQALATDVKSVADSVKVMNGSIEKLMTEWRQKADDERKQLEKRPGRIVEYVRALAAVVQATVLFIGATVGAIVYVSSNANNADLAVMRYRLEHAEKQLGARPDSWIPKVDKTALATK